MANNSSNINWKNNYLSHPIIKHKKDLKHMPMEIQVLTWDRHKQVAGLNWLMGSQSYPSGEFDLQR